MLEQFQAGDAESFGVLYDRYIRKIYDYIYFRVSHRETAEDLTSKTFLKALEHLSSFNLGGGTFQAWLYRIARNTVTDHWRTKKTEDSIDDHYELRSSEPSPADRIDAKRKLERVERYMKTLSAEQREIVMLRVSGGLSYREIAQIMGKSEAACKMAFSRSVALLRNPGALVVLYAIAIKHLASALL